MTVHSTQVSEAQVKLDGIQVAHSHETTYKRTEYAGAAAAILGAGVAMVSSLSECIHINTPPWPPAVLTIAFANLHTCAKNIMLMSSASDLLLSRSTMERID
jgi:hypothetical protein